MTDIYKKGFGKMPKSILLSQDLTATEKLVYGYLSCYANADGEAFPSEMRIMNDLNIGEDKLRRALKTLRDTGKITIERMVHNIYKLLENVYNGFSKLSKTVMTDRRLSEKAKEIYIFHRCFADFKDEDYTVDGGRSFPRRSQIMTTLGIKSINTYNKHFNQLKECGYIDVFQRYVNGRFGVNDYILCNNTDKSIDIENKTKKIAYGKKDENGNFHPENIIEYAKDGVKKAIKGVAEKVNKAHKTIKNTIKKTVDKKQSFLAEQAVNFSEKFETIRKNIQLDGLIKLHTTMNHTAYVKLINTAFNTMCEVLKQERDFKICGEIVMASRVHEVFTTLDFNIFEDVLTAIDSKIIRGEKIKNLKNYIVSALYNRAVKYS